MNKEIEKILEKHLGIFYEAGCYPVKCIYIKIAEKAAKEIVELAINSYISNSIETTRPFILYSRIQKLKQQTLKEIFGE